MTKRSANQAMRVFVGSYGLNTLLMFSAACKCLYAAKLPISDQFGNITHRSQRVLLVL